jgi:phosphoribosylformimino-5-aminoimidazole carboxamide ribotide isomerase
MQVWPAIDLRGGKCVRLRQGDYQRETVFSQDPVKVAKGFQAQGAQCLHLVDLDGARDGTLANRETVRAIVKAVDLPCELGGGIRDEAAIAELLSYGLTRLVIGTRAMKDRPWFIQMCRKYPQRLVLGIDARDGRVATDGWLETSDVDAVELARQLADEPLAAVIYTDISRDGMLEGPNLEAMATMQQAVSIEVVASGGITGREDVARLAEVPMAGCIIGRALYEGNLTLAEALEAAQQGQET